jgi:hypothetical protein
MFRNWLGIVLWLAPLAASAQAPTIIDFDDLTAPCDLGSASPLRHEYLALGVEFGDEFGNGAAVLDECSGHGLPGYSPPNFVVIDPGALLASGGTPDRLLIGFTGGAPYRVRVRAGGPPGTMLGLSCGICPWAWPGCTVTDTATLGPVTQVLEVSSASSFPLGCEVLPQGPAGLWIVDDLELDFQPPAPPVPTLTRAGAAVLAVLISVLGAAFILRFAGSR